jgi:hypothetical protein
VLGAPRWKGTTVEDVADAPPFGCTTTWVAVMVVPFVVPSTRTVSPAVTALTEAEVDPFVYVVEDASVTVTFWPADVVTVKPDVDTPLTVPVDPPAAGPDRALDPPPPGAPCPVLAGVVVAACDEGDVPVVDEDAAA